MNKVTNSNLVKFSFSPKISVRALSFRIVSPFSSYLIYSFILSLWTSLGSRPEIASVGEYRRLTLVIILSSSLNVSLDMDLLIS